MCGRDKKFNCKESLDRPVKPLKGMQSLQTKGCLPQISKDSPTHVTCRKCQLVVRTHHISKHKETASSSSFPSGLLYLFHFSGLPCQNFTIDGRKDFYGLWCVTLMLDVSRVELIEHVNSKKLCACNNCLDIDRNKLTRPAHSHTLYCYISGLLLSRNLLFLLICFQDEITYTPDDLSSNKRQTKFW